MQYLTSGKLYAADLWGVDFEKLNNKEFLHKLLKEAAELCGATVIGEQSKQFEPQGVTVLHMLSESHISCHSYPESGFIAIDCYTCGSEPQPIIAIDHVITKLKPEKYIIKKLCRGEWDE
jgi:S-adenosylmethionine decarboxylase